MERKRIGIQNRIISFILSIFMMTTFLPLFGFSAEEYDLPWLWPVPGSYQINSLDIYTDGTLHNNGQCIDIGANGYTGTNRLDVVSATSGTVFYICNKYSEDGNRGTSWGNYVIVQSGNTKIVYAHLQSVTCTYGTIKAGDVIGKMGNTGNSTGVHLHLQAYPSGSLSTSTEIKVFDKYISNPLYLSKFRFAKNLTSSTLYGEHIKSYYTSLSGSYYTYSGGLSTDYQINPVDCKVRVIATSGSPLRSAPIAENSYITGTVEKGKFIDVVGWTNDAYGVIWLKTKDGLWIKESTVGFYDYNDSITVDGLVMPQGSSGSLFDIGISGTVKSGNPIKSVRGEIYSGDNLVYSYEENAGKVLSANVGELLNLNFMAHALDDGDYSVKVYVKMVSSYPNQDDYEFEKQIGQSEFSINTDLDDGILPVIERIDISDVNENGFKVCVSAFDNRAISSVEIKYGVDEGNLSTVDAERNGSVFEYTVNTTEGGEYIIRVTATDDVGNSVTSERKYTFVKNSGETWQVVYKSGMNIRSKPSTSGTITATASYGDEFVILSKTTEKVSSTKDRIWALLPTGSYISLSYGTTVYLKYVSGYNNCITLDLNGGEGDIPSFIGKKIGETAQIPTTEPTREGATFLGWAESSSATEATYKSSYELTEEKTLHLFAVWSDSVSPTISSVTISPDTYTNGSVTVTVSATDNGDLLFYSFDGGKTWITEGTYVVKTNTEIPSGSIIVRDTFNNKTVYYSPVVISKIDKNPPSTENATVSVTKNKTKATFNVSGATDDLSGIVKTEVILSSAPDFTVSKSYDITKTITQTLANGVYYGKIKFTDGAGNYSEISIPRFAIGTVAKLSAPSGISAINTGSVYGDLVWGTVQNADGYEIEVSTSQSFDEVISVASPIESATVTGLSAGVTYFVRIKAVSSDGLYPSSDYSAVYSFVTLSDDSTLYGFTSLTDAVIDDSLHVCDYIADYTASSLDVTATVNEHATVEYYLSPTLDTPLSESAVTSFSFTEQSATVYLSICAENGSSTLYTLRIKRAGEQAETPEVSEFSDVIESVYVRTESGSASVSPSVSDGGTISVVWKLYNGTETNEIGNEFAVDLGVLPAGNYELYAVITNTNPKCSEKEAVYTTEKITFSVLKFSPFISLTVDGFVYSGNTAQGSISGYQGDGETSILFYSDSECKNEIESPINAGTYYAKAYSLETDTWLGGESAVVSFTISKAENKNSPEYLLTPPTPRNGTAYVTISSAGVEYSLNGSVYTAYVNEEFSLSSKDTLCFRFASTENYLASETITVNGEDYLGITDIVANGSNSTTRDGNYLFILEDTSVTLSYLKSGIYTSEYITYTDKNGEALEDTDVITTGSTVTLGDDLGVIVSVTVIVIGDVDCNGVSDINDARLVLSLSNGIKTAENEYETLAADYDGDKKITSTDALLIAMRG